MHKLFLVIPFAAALAGCTMDQFAQVEADALSVVASIKAKAPVIAAEIDATILKVCTALPAVNGTLMAVSGTIPNPGPKTAAALRNGNTAMAGAAAACDAYASTPTTTGKVNLLMKLWAGYTAGKAAAITAQAAGGA